MSEFDTAPPGTLLVLYVMGESDRTWWTQVDLRAEIERATGHEISRQTVSDVLGRLSDAGRVHERTTTTEYGPTVEYASNYRTAGGVDMGANS